MNIIAFDLSYTATGICRPNGDLATHRPFSFGEDRLDEIAAMVRDWCVQDAVDLAVIEDVPNHPGNHALGTLSLLHGAVRLQLMRKNVPYQLIMPMSLKKYCLGKLGKGVKKTDMRVEWLKRTGTDIKDDNQLDALMLWLMAHDHFTEAKIKMPAANREALAKVQWITMKAKPPAVQWVDAERLKTQAAQPSLIDGKF